MGIGLDQPSHWAIVAVAALLLFGYKKLPEMARSAGKSMRIFKTEIKGMAGDDAARDALATLPEVAAPAVDAVTAAPHSATVATVPDAALVSTPAAETVVTSTL